MKLNFKKSIYKSQGKCFWLLAFIFILSCKISTAQYVIKNELAIASRVKCFDTGKIIKVERTNNNNTSEVTLYNSRNQVLRFKIFQHKAIVYHCDIAFQLFDFKSAMLQRTSLYNRNGQPVGEIEFDNSSITEYFIKKPDLLKKRLAVIEKEDGNIDTNDAAEKIILAKIYTATHKLIRKEYISSSFYWQELCMLSRP